MSLAIVILLLVIITIALFIWRVHQFKQPRIIRWRIGHQVFTFRFPCRWMHISSFNYFRNVLAIIGAVVIGIVALVAILAFLFLFLGLILPVILIVILIGLILTLCFVI